MTDRILFRMVERFGSDLKRITHAFKVVGFAQTIASGEHLDSQTRDITVLAAILHDIGIPAAEEKYGSSAGHLQEKEGPPIAREILLGEGVPKAITDRVCYLVGHHHTYTKIDGIDFQILVEADLLVNIQEGYLTHEAGQSAIHKYFRTESGRKLASTLFPSTSED